MQGTLQSIASLGLLVAISSAVFTRGHGEQDAHGKEGKEGEGD